MARVNVMRDALRKRRVNLFKDEDVIRVFRRVEEKMTRYTDNFEIFRSKLRKYEGGRLYMYQEKVFKVNRAIEEGLFDDVIVLVSEGQQMRSEIDEGLDAIEAFDLASSLLKVLKLELNSKWLKQMPSILILEKALVEADELMKQGRYLQAKVLIKFCSIEVKDIKKNLSDIELLKKEEVIQKIQELKMICQQTREFSKYLTEDILEIEGRIEVVLYSFLDEGQIYLVGKLVEDLDFVLKDRRSFRDRMHFYHAITREKRLEIQQAIKASGWKGGVKEIFVEKFERFRKKLKETEEKLKSVQKGVNPK